MSHRPNDSDLQSSSSNDRHIQEPRALEPSLPPTLLGQPSSPRAHRHDIPRSQGFALPPLHQLSPSLEQRGQRPLGVHSILNPTQSDAPGPHGQRRSAAHFDYEPTYENSSFRTREAVGRPSSIGTSEDLAGRSTYLGSLDTSSRRMLTPRSPAHRAASVGRARAATAGNNTAPSPYTTSGTRSGAYEPSHTGYPPPAASSTAGRAGYGLTPVEVSQGFTARHRPAAQVPSSDASSSASFSPSQHSLTSLTSPSGPLAQFSVTSNPFGAGTQQASQGYGGPAAAGMYPVDRQYGIPIGTTGQSSVQFMTYETDRGPMQLPVDVHAGSRMADEKRKRNAGASARFRARRKEKEKEASTTIAKLEQQLREFTEDLDFYKRERDYMASIVYNMPGGRNHFPRPQSPRLRRAAQAQPNAYGGEATASYGHYGEHGERHESERPTRRRMTGYELPPPSQLGGGPSHEASQFAPPASFAAPPPLPAHNQPGSSRAQGSSSLPLPPPPPPPPRSGTYDPFAPSRYDRSWPPSGSGDQR